MLAGAAVLALALATGEAQAASPGDPGRGRELYAERCVLCHGGRGQGWDWSQKVATPPVPVADLTQVTSERSDAYLFEIVKDGGEAVGRTRFMPPFGFQLNDQDVWDLVAYMRALSRAGAPR
ncbi:MAG: c-type cytochrome [Candidatus Rokuibacteriota bacterium]